MSIADMFLLLSLAMAIVFVFLSDDKKSIEEYIRRHPDQFKRQCTYFDQKSKIGP